MKSAGYKRNLFLTGLVSLVCLVHTNGWANGLPKMKQGFISNQGQVLNQLGEPNKQVLFLYNGENVHVQLRNSGFSYDLSDTRDKVINHRIDVDFIGSNIEVEKLATDPIEGKLIFHSKTTIQERIVLQQYNRVLYKNIYPQTDIEFLIIDQEGKSSFKYNIILHPGADPDQVKLQFSGALAISANPEGNIQMKTRFGTVEERVPLSYELSNSGKQEKIIQAKFRQLRKGMFGLAIGNYNKTKTVVVDPMLWSTYYGGNSIENSGGMIFDNSGNIYISGSTASNVNIASTGAYQTTFSGSGFDAFIAKFSSTGTLLWATYFGGTGNDEINELAIDANQNLIFTGSSGSTTGISTAGAFQTTMNGINNGILGKFAPDGSILWATYYGGNGTDVFYGMKLDINGDILTCGSSSSTNVLTYPGIHQSTNAGLTDVFLVKFNNSGQVRWATYYGGSLNDNSYGICLDANRNIYVSGNTFSATGLSSVGALQTANAGNSDIYLAKFDSLGKLTYGSFYGGTASDVGTDITLDLEGKLIICGYTSSAANVATSGAFQTTITGTGYDGILLKMDTTGKVIWSTYYGGTGTEYIHAVRTDLAGNIYFGGSTTSSTNISTSGAYQTTLLGTTDGMFGSFDKNGARLWCSYFGGSTGVESIDNLLISNAGILYVEGETTSNDGISTTGAYQIARKGSTDAFLFKYDVGLPIVETEITDNNLPSGIGICAGSPPATIFGSSPGGGNGTYTYKWLSSNTGVAGSYVAASGLNTAINYSPGTLSSNMYFKRIVYSGSKIDTSNECVAMLSNSLNAGFTVNKTIQCLKNNQFIFSDTTTSASGTLGSNWDFGNGKTSSKQIDTITYDASVDNLFKVRLITTLDGGCADTNYRNVILINNPLAKTVTGPDSVMKGTTTTYSTTYTNGSSYLWMAGKGSGNSSTITINFKWFDIGDDTIKMVERNGGGCYGDTVYKLVYVKQPTGTEELLGQTIHLYPNPTEGNFFVESEKDETLEISVYSLTGNSIYTGRGNRSVNIDLNQIPSGIYLVDIVNEQGQTLHRKIQLL